MDQSSLLNKIEKESTDLALHVDLCHLRYIQLLEKIDHVDSKLDALEDIKKQLEKNEDMIIQNTLANYQKFLGWGFAVLVGACSWLGHYLLK